MSRYRSNENKGKKNSTVYTPEDVSQRISEIIKQSGISTSCVLDLAIGQGSLSKPFKGSKIIGVDISSKGKKHSDIFFQKKLENLTTSDILKIKQLNPNLVISNPPFNGASGKQLYPEIFIDWVFTNLGSNIPLVLITPMGLRLNQRRSSQRWRKLKDKNITSILSLPIDTFDGVLFHVEVLFFNIPNIKAHYFLED